MKLALVGDISLGEYYLSFGHGPRTYARANDIFEYVVPALTESDYVFGNLETPVSDIGLDEKNPESLVLRGEPDALSMLSNAGFTALCIANNHVVQHGEAVFLDTLHNLESKKITPLGAAESDIKIFEKNGIRLAVIVASDVRDNTDINQKSYEVFDSNKIKGKIKKIKNDVDWVLLYLHWGKEDCVAANDYQSGLIDEFKSCGANFIIGHHPHIFYPVEVENNFLSAPSLGNFVFDLCWDDRLTRSGILHLDLGKDVFAAFFTPIQLTGNGIPKPSGNKELLKPGTFIPYVNGADFSSMELKKVKYFIKNYFFGNTLLKTKFITSKLVRKFMKIKKYENNNDKN